VRLKLINLVKKFLINQDYHFVEDNSFVRVFYGKNNVYPEDYILFGKQGVTSEVFEVHRDEKKEILKSNDENFAIMTVVIICKRTFEAPNSEASITREIRNEVAHGNIGRANQILNENLNSNIFSILKEKFDRISLLRKGNETDIKFQNKYITENANLSRGYVVVYNYAKRLMEFEKIYSQLKDEFNVKGEYKKLANLYIFGKL